MAASCGRGFTLLVTEDGSMASFGLNSSAQLGCGNLESQGLPIFTRGSASFGRQELAMVAAGHEHAAAVSRSGDLWTWGSAQFGRLGIDFATESAVETREMAAERTRKLDIIMSVYPSSAIHALRPVRIPSSTFGHSAVTMVTCGEYFTLALTQAGRVWQCGSCYPYRTIAQVHSVQASVAFRQVDFPGLIDPVTQRNTKIVMIASGYRHMMALDENGVLWMWGKNMSGELGLGSTASREVSVPTAIPPSVFDGLGVKSMDGGQSRTMIVTVDDNLWACGCGRLGAHGIQATALGDENTVDVFVPEWVGGANEFGGYGVRMVACGGTHALIVTHENKVWSCGAGDSFALGLPQPDGNYYRPTLIPDRADFRNENIVMAAAGLQHSLVVKESGTVHTWGRSLRIPGSLTPRRVSPLGHSAALVRGDVPVLFPRLLVVSFTMHSTTQTQILPLPLRCGMWHRHCWLYMNQDAALAFAMVTHMRLGQVPATRELSSELVQCTLVDAMQFQPRYGEGLLALLGLYLRQM